MAFSHQKLLGRCRVFVEELGDEGGRVDELVEALQDTWFETTVDTSKVFFNAPLPVSS